MPVTTISFSGEWPIIRWWWSVLNNYRNPQARRYLDCNYNTVQFLVSPGYSLLVTIANCISSVNAHAEELRSHFVAHEGKKTLHVAAKQGFDFAYISKAMAAEIHENVGRNI